MAAPNVCGLWCSTLLVPPLLLEMEMEMESDGTTNHTGSDRIRLDRIRSDRIGCRRLASDTMVAVMVGIVYHLSE